MHGIDAKITRTYAANNRVEVGTVAIKVSPGGVRKLADFKDLALEEAAGVGGCDHDGGDVGAELGLEIGEVDAAVVGLGDLADFVADEGGGGRVGAVGGGGDQDGPPVALARRLVGGLDAEQAAELAVGAGLGRQGDGG